MVFTESDFILTVAWSHSFKHKTGALFSLPELSQIYAVNPCIKLCLLFTGELCRLIKTVATLHVFLQRCTCVYVYVGVQECEYISIPKLETAN